MCPACIAAAALAGAKLASAGGLAAYGVKKLLATNDLPASAPNPTPSTGDCNETAEHRIAR